MPPVPRKTWKQSIAKAFMGRTETSQAFGSVAVMQSEQAVGDKRLAVSRLDLPTELGSYGIHAARRGAAEMQASLDKLRRLFDEQISVPETRSHAQNKKSLFMRKATPHRAQAQHLRQDPPLAGTAVEGAATSVMQRLGLDAAEKSIEYNERILVQLMEYRAKVDPQQRNLALHEFIADHREAIATTRTAAEGYKDRLFQEVTRASRRLLDDAFPAVSRVPADPDPAGPWRAARRPATANEAVTGRERLRLAMESAFNSVSPMKIDARREAPSVLDQTLLTQIVKRVFQLDQPMQAHAADLASHRAAYAVRRIQKAEPAEVMAAIERAVTDPATLSEGDTLVLKLMQALAGRPGAPGRLADLMHLPMGATSGPAPILALALNALQSLRDRETNDTSMTGVAGAALAADRRLITAGLQHARRLVDPGSPAPADPQAAEIAYRGLQNGLTRQSDYDALDATLRMLHEDLPALRARNERAATGLLGRLVNSVSSSAPQMIGGAAPMPLRRSSMKNFVRSAIGNGMLPTREITLQRLASNTQELVAVLDRRLASPGGIDRHGFNVAIAVRGILSEVGAAAEDAKTARRLGKTFFEAVDFKAGGALQALGTEFNADWQALRSSRPNAGQVLAMVAQHVDLGALLRDEGPIKIGRPPLTLRERAERVDEAAKVAVQDFAALASQLSGALQSARRPHRAAPDLGEIEVELPAPHGVTAKLERLIALAKKSALAFDAIQPVSLLSHLHAQTLHNLELEMGDDFPAELKHAWQQLGRLNADAGQVMRLVQKEIQATLPEVLGQLPGAAGELGAALDRSKGSLRTLQRLTHAERLHQATADTITTFGDLRTPRDMRAMIESITQRISLGEKAKLGDSRVTRIDPLAWASTAFRAALDQVGLSVSFNFGDVTANERTLDVHMHAAALQVLVGETAMRGESAAVRGAAGFSLKKNKVVGISASVDGRLEVSSERSTFNGVALRFARTGGQEDLMRRKLADMLADLADPAALLNPAAGYASLAQGLLHRHPELVITQIEQGKSTTKSEGRVNLSLPRVAVGHMQFGPGGGISRRAQASSAEQKESGGRVKIDEYQLRGQTLSEAQVGLVGLSANAPYTDGNPTLTFLRTLAAYSATQQLSFDFTSVTQRDVRIGGATGMTLDEGTQSIVENDSFRKFVESVGDLHPWVTLLAGRDNTPGRTAAEKFAVAEHRLMDCFSQFAGAERPDVSYSVSRQLRAPADRATDALEALAQEARAAGDDAAAGRWHQSVAALRMEDVAWTARNIQLRSAAKFDSSNSFLLNIFGSKTSGESNSQHMYLPHGNEAVGRFSTILGYPVEAQSPLDRSMSSTEGNLLGSRITQQLS